MARDLSIPADAIRGRDLCSWHVVECECRVCRHVRVIPHDVLKRADRADKVLTDLNFRCAQRHCGATGPHMITVRKLPRNW